MIALIDETACTGCGTCATVCPTLVFDHGATGAVPAIARIEACQTCYLCELYCPADAIHVGANQFAREEGAADAHLRYAGHIRADHGWEAPLHSGPLDDYRRLGPLLNEGVQIAARRYAARHDPSQ
ncbi:MAG TPA: ferredoxin family protein [Novosphingobium sp.]|nr:ferredoxin family protein [Novosphingobium sp.]